MKTERFLVAVTDDDNAYYIYNAHDLIEQVEKDPLFVSGLLNQLAVKTWCEAFDMSGRPVWLRTSTIVRVEYREITHRYRT